VRLRPETEQELATRLWRPQLDEEILRASGVSEYRLVVASWIYCNSSLQWHAHGGNFYPLHGRAGGSTPVQLGETLLITSRLLQWRSWCLERDC